MKTALKKIYYKALLIFGYKPVHFIHVGKTAGSAVRSAFALKSRINGTLFVSGKHVFVMHGHSFTLKDCKKGEIVFFVVRDPISRYISGFYSRLREGKPKNYNPWKTSEAEAFKNFGTPNSLGEALGADDKLLREKAENAMNNIGHVKSSYWDWFENEKYLDSNLNKIGYILRHEMLNSDLCRFNNFFNTDIELPPQNSLQSHATPRNFDKKLSDKAIKNLKNWYKKEYDFLNFLHENNLMESYYE